MGDLQMELAEARAKAAEYEAFIENRLKMDLKSVLDQRDKLLRQIADYLTLKNNLMAIEKNELKAFKTLVNLGSEFYIQAKVPDASKVFVNVGLGFHVEFTPKEALSFIELKEAHLTERVNELAATANSIKSRIRTMYAGIAELMKLATINEADGR